MMTATSEISLLVRRQGHCFDGLPTGQWQKATRIERDVLIDHGTHTVQTRGL